MTSRSLLVLIAILSLAAVGIALISQHVFGIQPCAWCVLQRLIYVAIAIICLLGAAGRDVPQRTAAALGGLLAICGIAAAWYQYSVASHMLSCNRTFADRFMVQSGLDASLPSIFGIFASCADAVFKVLGVDYSIWSLVLFIVIAILAITALRKRRTAVQASLAA